MDGLWCIHSVPCASARPSPALPLVSRAWKVAGASVAAEEAYQVALAAVAANGAGAGADAHSEISVAADTVLAFFWSIVGGSNEQKRRAAEVLSTLIEASMDDVDMGRGNAPDDSSDKAIEVDLEAEDVVGVD